MEEKSFELFKIKAEDRIALFDKKLTALQKTYGVNLYACQQVTKNGEIVTIIKVMDMLPVQEEVQANKKDVDKSKEGDIASSKA